MSMTERRQAKLAPYESYRGLMVPWLAPLIYAMPPDQVVAVGVYSSAAVANGQTRRPGVNGSNPSDTDFFVITKDNCPSTALRLSPESGWVQDTSVRQVVPGAYRFINPQFAKQFPEVPPPDVYFWPEGELGFHTQGNPASKARVVSLDGDITDNISRIADSILHSGTIVYVGQEERLKTLLANLIENLLNTGEEFETAGQIWPINTEWHNAIAGNLQQMAIRSLPYVMTNS